MPVNKHHWRFRLKQSIFVNLSATFIAQAFNLAGFGMRTLTVKDFVESFVYSNCIGTLISVVIFFISPRWDENPLIVRLVKVFVAILVATFFGVMLARFILSLIYPYLAQQGLIPGWQNFLFSLGIALSLGFGAYFYEFSQTKLYQKELDEEKAKTLATEAQLASLESRIHPHFLFNTLNSIAALIHEDPILAEKMVEKFSALLRYSLDSNSKNLVSLKQELEITEKYLEIEKMRFGERLDYQIGSAPQLLETKLPPLSLQTLVENSIKHVASKTSEKTEIVIIAKQTGAGVVIEVSDNGKGFGEDEVQKGHGLDVLRKRLTTIFGDEADLEIVENKTGCVKLRLPKLSV